MITQYKNDVIHTGLNAKGPLDIMRNLFCNITGKCSDVTS